MSALAELRARLNFARAPEGALRQQLAGFTLLEVMIAVVILAVGLASLFTSEAGAIRIAQRARTTTIATLLARCKMAEIEEKVAKEGFPGEELEGHDECCEEAEHQGFKCDWKLARIKLPETELDDESKDQEDSKSSSSKKSKPGDNMLDALAGISKQEPGERLNGITDALSGAGSFGLTDSTKKSKDTKNPEGKDRPRDSNDISGTDADPMSSMVMGLAFPLLRPVIEEGTRRASVKVLWKEGASEQTFEVVQFMVSEEQIILPDIDSDDGGVASPSTPATSTTTSTSTSKSSSGTTK